MLKLKTKWFNKWAEKNSISDELLTKALKNISYKLSTVNLGGDFTKDAFLKSVMEKAAD